MQKSSGVLRHNYKCFNTIPIEINTHVIFKEKLWYGVNC